MVRTLAALAIATVGCSQPSVFVCTDEASCGPTGVCESDGYCSFPDDACSSGRRYGELAPNGVAGRCVDPEVPQTSTTSGSATTIATTDPSTQGDATTTTFESSTTTSGGATESSGTESATESTTDGATSSSTGVDPQPTVLGPMLIADDLDDGAMWPTQGMIDGEWLPSGETVPGRSYLGEYPVGRHYFAYFRFVLPDPIPAGSTVVAASFGVDGHGTYLWDGTTDALRLWMQRIEDAPQVTGLEDYPGDMSLTAQSVRWPAAGGLRWNVAGPNLAPDIAPVLQELVDASDGLAEGSAVQVWIGIDEPGAGNREVGWLDTSDASNDAATLTVTIVRP